MKISRIKVYVLSTGDSFQSDQSKGRCQKTTRVCCLRGLHLMIKRKPPIAQRETQLSWSACSAAHLQFSPWRMQTARRRTTFRRPSCCSNTTCSFQAFLCRFTEGCSHSPGGFTMPPRPKIEFYFRTCKRDWHERKRLVRES